jgi:cytochrome c553
MTVWVRHDPQGATRTFWLVELWRETMKWAFWLRFLLPMFVLVPLVLMAGASGLRCWHENDGGRGRPPHTAGGGRATQERERLLAMGRDLFYQRCGSCHDADGSKPMADGPPLNQRKVSEERVSRVVESRFKNATEEQRRAVKLHINSFMKR